MGDVVLFATTRTLRPEGKGTRLVVNSLADLDEVRTKVGGGVPGVGVGREREEVVAGATDGGDGGGDGEDGTGPVRADFGLPGGRAGSAHGDGLGGEGEADGGAGQEESRLLHEMCILPFPGGGTSVRLARNIITIAQVSAGGASFILGSLEVWRLGSLGGVLRTPENGKRRTENGASLRGDGWGFIAAKGGWPGSNLRGSSKLPSVQSSKLPGASPRGGFCISADEFLKPLGFGGGTLRVSRRPL